MFVLSVQKGKIRDKKGLSVSETKSKMCVFMWAISHKLFYFITEIFFSVRDKKPAINFHGSTKHKTQKLFIKTFCVCHWHTSP